jgi:hypothetical protein
MMYSVSLKGPISSKQLPYTIAIACRHIAFMEAFGESRKRWYRSLKNSCLKEGERSRAHGEELLDADH